MLLCSIPRPSKHANPPLNTHTTHYTIPLASYPRLAHASTLLQRLKDAHTRTHTHTKMCNLLKGARNSQYWFNYNLVHCISHLLTRLWLMPKAQAMTVECQSVFKDVNQRRLLTFMSWDLSGGTFIGIFCLVEVSRLFLMSEWSHSISEYFDIKYSHHTFKWTNST